MSVFMKSCFNCGKKTKKLFDNLCEDCFKESNPPIKEIKPLNLKICNMCGKIHYNNALYELKEIEEMLPNIMKKNIVINEGYNLKEVQIKNFEKIGNKVVFDLDTVSELSK